MFRFILILKGFYITNFLTLEGMDMENGAIKEIKESLEALGIDTELLTTILVLDLLDLIEKNARRNP